MQKKINAQKLKIAAGLIFKCHPPDLTPTRHATGATGISEQRNLAKFFYVVHRSHAANGLSGKRGFE